MAWLVVKTLVKYFMYYCYFNYVAGKFNTKIVNCKLSLNLIEMFCFQVTQHIPINILF